MFRLEMPREAVKTSHKFRDSERSKSPPWTRPALGAQHVREAGDFTISTWSHASETLVLLAWGVSGPTCAPPGASCCRERRSGACAGRGGARGGGGQAVGREPSEVKHLSFWPLLGCLQGREQKTTFPGPSLLLQTFRVKKKKKSQTPETGRMCKNRSGSH